MPEAADAIALLTADHDTVRELCTKYEGLGDRAGSQLSESIEHHVEEEESEMLPRVGRALNAAPDEPSAGVPGDARR